MKKYAFMLLPLLLSALTGCGKSENGVAKDINKAVNLKFDEKYSETLPESCDEDVYSNVESVFYGQALTVKSVHTTYDEKLYDEYDRVNSTYDYYEYTLYEDYALKYHRECEDKNYIINKKENVYDLEGTYKFDYSAYYNESEQTYYYHQVRNGYHYLGDVDLSVYTESHRNNYIQSDYLYAFDSCFSNLSYAYFYKSNDGFVAYHEEIQNGIDGDLTTKYQIQVIYEFDSAYRLIRGSFLEERLSDFDYVTDKKIEKMKVNEYVHATYEISYGKKESKSIIADSISKNYGIPYFEYGYLNYEDCSIYEDNYSDYKFPTPQSLHIEGYISFNQYKSETIDVTPSVDYAYRMGIGGDSKDESDDNIQNLKIKNPQQLKYKDNKLLYEMNNSKDALWFKIDYVLEDTTVTFKSGTVEIVDKAYIIEYFDNYYIM